VSDRSVAAHYGPATILPWRFGPSGPVIPLGSGNRMVPWAVPSAYGKRSENWTAFVSYKMIVHLLADEGGSYERAGDHHRGYSDASATVADLVARDANEGDTRLLVTDFLCDGPGFDKYADLTTEYQVKGEFADYGLRIDRGLVAFIEVKRVALAQVLFSDPVAEAIRKELWRQTGHRVDTAEIVRLVRCPVTFAGSDHAAFGRGRPQRCWRLLRTRARSRHWTARMSGGGRWRCARRGIPAGGGRARCGSGGRSRP
jgi:hypothetical protein